MNIPLGYPVAPAWRKVAHRRMHILAAEFGVATGTVQRIKAEMEKPQ